MSTSLLRRYKHHNTLKVRSDRRENSKLYRHVKAAHIERKLSPGEIRTSTTQQHIWTYKRSEWKTCPTESSPNQRRMSCQRTELCSSRTETCSRSHHSKSHPAETTVSRHTGRTVTVEGISCSCYYKITALQPHYWEKEGPGITLKTLEHHHHASRCTLVLNTA